MSQFAPLRPSQQVNPSCRINFLLDAVDAVCDDKAHFARSSSPTLVPLVAINEALEAIEAYVNEPQHALKAVQPAFSRAIRVLNTSAAKKFTSSTFFDDFKKHAQELTSRSTNQDSGASSAYIKNNTELIKQSLLKAQIGCSSSKEYQRELYSNINDLVFNENENDRSVFKDLDKISKELVAFIAAQGRTTTSFNLYLRQNLPSLDPIHAIEFLKVCLLSEPSDFQVAVVVDGTAKTEGLKRKDFFIVFHNKQITWLSPEKNNFQHVANTDLARFCNKHWGTQNTAEPSNTLKMSTQIMLVKVKAWDHEQARHEALDRAEALVDLINAEHRATGFGVKRKVAVWREGDKEVFQLPITNGTVTPTTRLMNISRSPSVDRSLRFASRAANERAGSMQTFFCWIALEYLGRGGRLSPQNTISAAIPDLVSLVAVKQLVFEAWHELTRLNGPEALPKSVLKSIQKIENRNKENVSAHIFNKKFLAHLIISDGKHVRDYAELTNVSVEEASKAIDHFTDYKKTLPDFSQYKLQKLRSIMREPNNLKYYMEDVHRVADTTMQRMRFVRNQTAHTASSTSTEHMELSKASLIILDAVFESVTRIQGKPVDSFAKISDHRKEVINRLNKHTDKHLLAYDLDKNFLV